MSALAGAERVFDVMDQTPELDEGKKLELKNVRGEVVLENVTFGYNPDKVILKNISMYAHPGQKIALVGSTGAGKTTITNLMTRFYNIDEGKITIDGIDIKDISLESLRENIAMVLQDTHLFTGTIMENIRYGRLDATDAEVRMAAQTSSAGALVYPQYVGRLRHYAKGRRLKPLAGTTAAFKHSKSRAFKGSDTCFGRGDLVGRYAYRAEYQ